MLRSGVSSLCRTVSSLYLVAGCVISLWSDSKATMMLPCIDLVDDSSLPLARPLVEWSHGWSGGRTGSDSCRNRYSGNVTTREAWRNRENTVQPGVLYSAACYDSHCTRAFFPSPSHVFFAHLVIAQTKHALER